MEKTTSTTLGGLLLSSTQPERLGEWYVAALAPDEDTKVEQYRILGFAGVHVLIDSRDDVSETNPEPGRLILNFDVPDARAAVARIDALGSPWLAPLEDRDGSLFATTVDPDGNYVQLIELSEKERAALSKP